MQRKFLASMLLPAGLLAGAWAQGQIQQGSIQFNWKGTALAGVELRNIQIGAASVGFDIYNGGNAALEMWTVSFAETDTGQGFARYTPPSRAGNDIPPRPGEEVGPRPQPIAPGKSEHFLVPESGVKWVALVAVQFSDNSAYGEAFALDSMRKAYLSGKQNKDAEAQAAAAVLAGKSPTEAVRGLAAANNPGLANMLAQLQAHPEALRTVQEEAQELSRLLAQRVQFSVRGGLQ